VGRCNVVGPGFAAGDATLAAGAPGGDALESGVVTTAAGAGLGGPPQEQHRQQKSASCEFRFMAESW